jgi:S-(hydroxymethyl)glutathione dehydrogenase/alcohol dehydrogenase
MKSEAAILWETGGTWSVEEIELDPPKAGEVLVEMVASGMCHSDDHARTGDLPAVTPLIGGHEGSGIVMEVGEGVTSVAPGDHVVFSFVPACGRCQSCADGHSNLCDNGAALLMGAQLDGTSRHHARGKDLFTMVCLGTFGRHTVVNEMSCVKIEDDIPLELACLVGCGVTTGWGSSVYAAEVRPGDNVAVIGVGGIGAAAVQGARLAGARNIVAIDPVEFKREKAMEMGATHTYSSIDEALLAVPDLTWGDMCEGVILTPGVITGDMIEPALGLVAKGGTLVVTALASLMDNDVSMNLFMFAMMNKEVKGTVFGSGNPRADIPALLSMYREGTLKLDELITSRYTLDQVNQGYDDMRAGKNIRGVIEF